MSPQTAADAAGEDAGADLAAALRAPHRGVSLGWLGQAGFLVRLDEAVLLIDPYLSDSLAAKYRGRRFDHRRLVPPPIAPSALPRVDAVLCTHRHGDHMDPGTLPPIAEGHPSCRFVVPEADRESALALGLAADRLVGASAGVPIPLDLARHPVVTPVRAAHERLETDARGEHRFLGYAVAADGLGLYHSGDCVPFPGLAAEVAAFAPTLALLPVNGRDDTRRAAGVPGNFTLDEAVEFARALEIETLVPHHWGMFAFNTCDPAAIAAAARAAAPPRLHVPHLGRLWRII